MPMGRTYSTSAKWQQGGERKWTLLYHRDPSRMTIPRSMLGVSTFNMVYWSWYCLDFTPSINASAHDKLAMGQIDAETLNMILIDPNMGYVGLTMASVIWLGSYLYTKQIVSAIWGTKNSTQDDESMLAVSTLKLPLLTRPKILAKTVYDPENNAFRNMESIEFTESELRSESSVEFYEPGELTLSEARRKNDVIVKFEGDFSKLKGHTAIKKDGGDESGPLGSLLQQKYLLDIESEDEVMPNANPILLRSFVLDDYHLQSDTKGRRDYSKTTKEDIPVRTNIGKSIKRKKGFKKRR